MSYRGVPTKVPLKANVVQVAAGGNHTLLLTSFGQVYTFGSHKVSLSPWSQQIGNKLCFVTQSENNFLLN